jgi:hypothetical protein
MIYYVKNKKYRRDRVQLSKVKEFVKNSLNNTNKIHSNH